MVILLLKGSAVWLTLVIAAILNGLFREKMLVPTLGSGASLPLSGVSLSLLVFVVTLALLPFIGRHEASTYPALGAMWVAFTLAFEFLFGHFAAGKSWTEILAVFHVWKGDLFLVVLLVTFFSPYLAARVRGFI